MPELKEAQPYGDGSKFEVRYFQYCYPDAAGVPSYMETVILTRDLLTMPGTLVV